MQHLQDLREDVSVGRDPRSPDRRHRVCTVRRLRAAVPRPAEVPALDHSETPERRDRQHAPGRRQDDSSRRMTVERRRRGHAVALLVFAGLLGACTWQTRQARQAGPGHLVERARASMGSELRLKAWTPDETRAVAAFDAVFREFDRLEDLMSVWREGSDIVRLNAGAGAQPVPVRRDVRDALTIARQVSEWTGGKFDVTFGVLSGLWKFDYQDKDGAVPDRR